MKKQNLTERTFWICDNCGKEHELKMLFCDECGTERNKMHIITSSTPVAKSNCKAINLFIIISAVCLWVLWILCFNSFYASIPLFSLFNIILIIAALVSMFKCKTVKLWQRITVLLTTILLNPVVWVIGFMMFYSICYDRLQERVKQIDKISLVEACYKIVMHPSEYKEKYIDDFSALPESIRKIKPNYVWVDNNSVGVKLKCGSAKYSFMFSQNNNSNWNLSSYYGIKNRAILLSNIVINADTGKVN